MRIEIECAIGPYSPSPCTQGEGRGEGFFMNGLQPTVPPNYSCPYNFGYDATLGI
jgi:hypothetical protein